MLSLKQSQVVEITGMKSETLQAWIKRGLVPFPDVGSGNHRTYDFMALSHVAIMVEATKLGIGATEASAISKAARSTVLYSLITGSGSPPSDGRSVITSSSARMMLPGPLGAGVIAYSGGMIRDGGWADEQGAPEAFIAINVTGIVRRLLSQLEIMGLPTPDPFEPMMSIWGRGS